MSPVYRRVASYEILAEIGSGGMADVYVADDRRTGSRVALKIPRQDPEIRRAERDGALLQQHLAERDPRVARVFEIGEDDGVAFVAMEYVSGQDLSERIARGPMDPNEAVRIAIELCDLLATAHACTPPVGETTRRGIVHGDLKPRNIRIEPGGRVCVVDFGIAKALSETRRLTRNEFGSLSYSSPERIRSGNVDAHSDLWSIAVVLYEMLAGRTPFRGDNPRQLEERILSGARPEPLTPLCSPALDAVLRKALEPDLNRRYREAAQLRADLVAASLGGATVAEREGPPPIASIPDDGVDTGRDEATRRTRLDDATRRSSHDVSPGGTGGDATRRTPPAGTLLTDEATRRTVVANGAATARTVPATHAVPSSTIAATYMATAPSNAAPATAAAPSTPAPPATATAAAPFAPAPPPGAWTLRRLRTLFVRVSLLAVLALVVNEVLVMNAAGDMETALRSYARPDAPKVWSEFQDLRERSVLRFGTWSLAARVRDWHVSAADDLTADYLSDTPTIRERGWLQAEALLRRAAEVRPRDNGVRARTRYVEGQLARIDAEAKLERDPVAARARFNVARRAFDDAARMRNWPDPHLGLARVYAVGFADVDKTQEELRQAEQVDYVLGNREIALVADAHRLRAERTWRAIPGLPDEERYLDRIESDCQRAIELYGEVPAYREVSKSIRRTHTLLEQVRARQDAIRRSKSFFERLGEAARDLVTPAGSY